MASAPKKKSLFGDLPKLHEFFLNPYTDTRFSTCPQCNNKTKIRKKPFLIHIDPDQLLMLNMSGPYCPYCDLMILHKDAVEAFLATAFSERRPEIMGNAYFVMGTVERKLWAQSLNEPVEQKAIFANLHVFKQFVTFEPPKWERTPPDELTTH